MIAARTDAMRTEDYAEGVRRAKSYAEAGADLVMLFPNTDEEARRAPHDCSVPLIYVDSSGNRVGRPVYTSQQLEEMGYEMVAHSAATIIADYRAVRSMLERLKTSGETGQQQAEAMAVRKATEDTIGLEAHYRVEEQTVERGGGV